MATKTVKKAAKEEKEEKAEVYFYGLGRRKASIAQVRIFASDKGEEAIINKRKMKDYFPTLGMQNSFAVPFKVADVAGKFRVEISVKGGGRKGQLGACVLGMARALVKFNPELKKLLKAEKLMTRDSRVVERKKPGLKKARKAPQWAKR